MAKHIILVIGRSMTDQEKEALLQLYKRDNLELIEQNIKNSAELMKWKKTLGEDTLVAVVIPINFNRTIIQKMVAANLSPKGEVLPFIYPSYDQMKRFICFIQYVIKLETVKAMG